MRNFAFRVNDFSEKSTIRRPKYTTAYINRIEHGRIMAAVRSFLVSDHYEITSVVVGRQMGSFEKMKRLLQS